MPGYRDEKEKGSKEGVLDRAKRCFKLAQEAEAKQRERERDDLRFQVPEYQWDESARRQRLGTTVDGVPTPARPILSISKLDQPLQLVLNQARAARLGVNIHPVSERADKQGAEIRQGLYRRIERDSNADMARLWALDRASKAGRGVYRISTKWDEDADPETFDQEIVIEHVLHQESVYFDPSAKKLDFSDGEWAFVAEWMSFNDFRRKYPDSDAAKTGVGDKLEWANLEQEAPGWVRADGDEQALLVAEYWYKEHDYQTIEFGAGKDKRTREKDIVSVKLCVITGAEILSQEEWEGQYIPLVPVIGRELQPFDSERRWVGMIGPAKDAQRLYNYAASSAVELAALEPKAPWVGAEGQFEGHESEWQQSNTRNLPYLEYKPTSLGAEPLPPPTRVQVDVSRLGPSMSLLQQADNFIQTTTHVFDPSLGRESASERSGKAILALQQQSDAGTSHYLASLADISMRLEARIVLDLLPKIYDRPGRVTTILRGENDASEAVMLNAPYFKGQDGSPERASLMGRFAHMGQEPLEYDLSKGKYSVSVTIGKSFQTRLQQGADEMGEILQARPELLPMLGDLYFGFRDFPGAAEISKRLAKMREQQFPGLGEDGEASSPEQLQAQMQGLRQENEALKKQLQEAAKAVETDQAKHKATVAKAQIDARSKENIAGMEQQTKLLLQAMTEKFEALQAMLQRTHERESDREDRAVDIGTKALDLTFKGPNPTPLGGEERY